MRYLFSFLDRRGFIIPDVEVGGQTGNQRPSVTNGGMSTLTDAKQDVSYGTTRETPQVRFRD